MWFKALGLVTACLMPGQSLAEEDIQSGNYMFTACTAERASYADGYCLGRTTSLLQGLITDRAIEKMLSSGGDFTGSYREAETAFDVCVPTNATQGQITDVMVKFLKDYPEDRHKDYGILILTAMQEAFPCEPVE
ncbi:Rap1a/Tai family immunity protein [Halovulum sp. GXIMD14793]